MILRLLALLAVLALGLPLQADPPTGIRHVFLVSIDGGKPAVIRQSRMPTLSFLARRGATTWEARTVMPSITLVSHTSMLTGLLPTRHGISWNDWEPEKGMLRVPTVFSLAKAAKKTTGLYAGKEKFLHLSVPPGALDSFAIPTYSAREVAQQAARTIRTLKPHLFFVHFADTDGAGHDHGWGSPEQLRAFGDVDGALRTILRAIRQAGIEKESVVIVTADHGGHEKTHGTDSLDDLLIPWIAWGRGVKKGFSITAPVSTCDTAATALWLLGIPVPADWDGKPVTSAFYER